MPQLTLSRCAVFELPVGRSVAQVDIRGSAGSGHTGDVATVNGWPDALVVARLRDRDEATFQVLVRAWSPMMLRIAGGYVGSTATAEEVVQETWLAVVRGVDRFEGRSALRTWVLRICVNQAKRAGLRESRIQPSGMPTTDNEGTVDPTRFRLAGEEWAGYWTPEGQPANWGPEARLLTGEVREVLVAALRALPRRQAQVVALRDVHGLDSAEVADLIGISEGNVRVLLHRGRAALRLRLEDFYRTLGRAG
jgi:RNA polymerase sigma-70 factor (ECF subfamily)